MTVNANTTDLVWTLVAKGRRKAKGCALGAAIESIAVREKIDPARLRRAFGALRSKIPTVESEVTDFQGAQKFYDTFGIYAGGDDEADYAHAVIQAGKRSYRTFVNPKRTWAQRTKIAREKMCIKPGGNVWWAYSG